MKVLLVNPNTFINPPVPPIGLEYLSSAMSRCGHEVRIVDLTFSQDITGDIDLAVAGFMPDITGITVRNIDSVLFLDNEFYLDHIRDVVRHIRSSYGLKVIAGGAGVRADPEGVLDYIGADFLVAGPGEGIICDMLNAASQGKGEKRIWEGFYAPYSACLRNVGDTDYRKYSEKGGIAGFETHKGCSSSCVYCIEANTPVSFRRNEDILTEIRALSDRDQTDLHLCDSEFNEDLDQAIEFLLALKAEALPISWSLYMKPANYNQKLFRLMKNTGVKLITLTADSFKKCPLYWSDIEKIIFSARSSGIRIVVDFLTGFPYEDEAHLNWCLDFFRRLQPDRVNINTYIRLYRCLAITKIIERDSSLNSNLIGSLNDGAMMLPMFYNHIQPDRLKELLCGDRLFAVEGESKGVNYMK